MKIRIASYNIRKAVGLDWRRRPQRIESILAELDADVVILQEADRRFGKRAGVLSPSRLFDSLGYSFADVATRQHSHGWHGNTILYRQPFHPLASARVALPKLEPRGAVSVLFSLPSVGPLRVVGAHLSVVTRYRERQVAAIVAHSQAADGNFPTVIAGDFNDRRSDELLQRSLGEEYTMVTPGASFHTSRPIWPLDRFAVKGALTPINSFVHNSGLASKASDHLPIGMDLQVRQ